ncbi:MAG: hypothetical protein ACXVDZ_10005 [Bacteroidia bacterium]
MKIIINDHRKIFGIQEEFSKLFPFLRIEFYSKSPNLKGHLLHQTAMPSARVLGDCRIVHNKGTITITQNMTINELSQAFSDTYGLIIHIQRKSGNAWIETSMTGEWTLEEQNNQGKELSLQKK